MQTSFSELFILMANLSQLKNRDRIIQLYTDGIQASIPNHNFKWSDKTTPNENTLTVCTRSKTYGYIACDTKLDWNSELRSFLQNSSQVLAIILENLENANLLKEQKESLQQKVDEQTSSLLQKQDELNEINEEYATLNEELQSTNQNLQKTNKHLEDVIIENQNNLKQLEQSETYFKSLFNYSSSPILAWDDCFVITQFNKAFEKISGFSADEVIGKNIDILFSNNTIEEALDHLAKTHEGELLEGVELEITRKNGTKRNIIWNTAPILDSEGNVTATIAQGNDVTSLKQAYHKIKEAEKRQASIIDGTRAGTWEWNIQTGETVFNEMWANIIGYTLKELEPVSIETWIKFSHPDDLMLSNQLLEKHFNREIDYYEMVARMKHKNGHWIWVVDRGKVTTWDDDGKPLLMYGTHQDITERKNAEIALRDSEHLLNQSQTTSLIGSYVLDINAGKWKASKMLHDIFGISEDDDHSIKGWLNITHPDDRGTMQNYFINEVIKQKKRFDKEYRIISIKDQKEKWVHGIGKLEFDSKGNPIRLIGTIQDISERKRVMNELFETNELLSQFILHSPIYAFIKEVTPTESRVVKASENYKEMIGLPRSEMIGKNMFELFPKELAETMTADDWDVVSKGISIKTDEELNNRYYTSIKFPIKLGTKNLLAGYTIDITDRKQAEIMVQLKNEELTIANKKLKKAKEKAEESDRLKSSFLANMSHEIRTPLNSIMGFASLLPEEEIKELVNQYAKIIVQNSEQLVSIIDGIVLYSKLQTGLLQCNPSSFSVNTFCEEIIQSFGLPEYQNKIALIFEPKEQASIELFNDYDKLRQILTNLISNAYKYTRQGSIKVGYKVHKKNIEFIVKDTGIGIPKNELTQILERFYRGSNVDQASVRGTGLGLSIVKELVELLGGKIWVKSKVGTGTTFHFTVKRNKKN